MSETPERDGSTPADVLTTHEYDGIQEYDNPMPGWWTWTFVATVVWSVVYVVAINVGIVPDAQDQLRAELEAAAENEALVAADVPQVTPELLAEAADDEEIVAQGAKAYTMNCASCHGQKGEGLIGPNLTDDAWIHGGEPIDVHRIVRDGVVAKGMPGWDAILSPDDLVAVVAFVETLKGTDPPNAKGPEGDVATDGSSPGSETRNSDG